MDVKGKEAREEQKKECKLSLEQQLKPDASFSNSGDARTFAWIHWIQSRPTPSVFFESSVLPKQKLGIAVTRILAPSKRGSACHSGRA